jgi:hypothetical protein
MDTAETTDRVRGSSAHDVLPLAASGATPPNIPATVSTDLRIIDTTTASDISARCAALAAGAAAPLRATSGIPTGARGYTAATAAAAAPFGASAAALVDLVLPPLASHFEQAPDIPTRSLAPRAADAGTPHRAAAAGNPASACRDTAAAAAARFQAAAAAVNPALQPLGTHYMLDTLALALAHALGYSLLLGQRLVCCVSSSDLQASVLPDDGTPSVKMTPRLDYLDYPELFTIIPPVRPPPWRPPTARSSAARRTEKLLPAVPAPDPLPALQGSAPAPQGSKPGFQGFFRCLALALGLSCLLSPAYAYMTSPLLYGIPGDSSTGILNGAPGDFCSTWPFLSGTSDTPGSPGPQTTAYEPCGLPARIYLLVPLLFDFLCQDARGGDSKIYDCIRASLLFLFAVLAACHGWPGPRPLGHDALLRRSPFRAILFVYLLSGICWSACSGLLGCVRASLVILWLSTLTALSGCSLVAFAAALGAPADVVYSVTATLFDLELSMITLSGVLPLAYVAKVRLLAAGSALKGASRATERTAETLPPLAVPGAALRGDAGFDPSGSLPWLRVLGEVMRFAAVCTAARACSAAAFAFSNANTCARYLARRPESFKTGPRCKGADEPAAAGETAFRHASRVFPGSRILPLRAPGPPPSQRHPHLL